MVFFCFKNFLNCSFLIFVVLSGFVLGEFWVVFLLIICWSLFCINWVNLICLDDLLVWVLDEGEVYFIFFWLCIVGIGLLFVDDFLVMVFRFLVVVYIFFMRVIELIFL